MWGNICLLGTLTIFGYLHLICIARNATRLLLLLLRPPTTTPTPLGMTTTTTTTTPLSTLCTALCIRVVFQMTGALRCAAQSIFGMSLPITPFQYLRRILSTFLFCFVPPPFLSPYLSLLHCRMQWRKLQINQAKRRPSKCTRPVRTMTPSPARHCPACRRRASPTPMRAVNRNIL